LRKRLPISVIVPTYNRADYLAETLTAILSQQDQELELIVVDDFSSDNSRNLLTSFKKEHPKIVLVFLEENLGESNAVNVGWSLATKQFISIVNSDDPPHKSWLLDMTKEIEGNLGFGFYYPNREVIDENGRILRKEVLKDWSTKILFENLVPVASAGLIIDRESLPASFEPRDVNVVFPSDLIQMFRLGLLTRGFRVKSAWGTWRQHSESISGSQSSMMLAQHFESSVGKWLNENEQAIRLFSRNRTRQCYFYGHIALLFRREFGVMNSLFLLTKTSASSAILRDPFLFFVAAHIAIVRTFIKLKRTA
jgi:glycosyltransferase involved in cell wall biosynthesis